MNNVRRAIESELDAMERQLGVTVLFAAEAGDRMRGIADKDARHEVRCVYVRPRADYDTFPRPVAWVPEAGTWISTDELEIEAMDVREMLSRLRAPDVPTIEWTASNVTYREHPAFSKVREMVPACVNDKEMARQYLSRIPVFQLRWNEDATFTNDRYIDMVRAALSARHLIRNHTPAPTSFQELMGSMTETGTRDVVYGLVVNKMCGLGDETQPRLRELDDWVCDVMNQTAREMQAIQPERPIVTAETMDAAFERVLDATDGRAKGGDGC